MPNLRNALDEKMEKPHNPLRRIPVAWAMLKRVYRPPQRANVFNKSLLFDGLLG